MDIVKINPRIIKGLSEVKPKCQSLNTVGRIDTLLGASPKIAIVGSRKISPEVFVLTARLSEELSLAGATIISGMALGTDTAVHTGAVRASGKTVAFLGSGISNYYPEQNRDLGRRMVKEKGLIVSEYNSDETVKAWRLINRNRLIVASSDIVVIIASGKKSGTVYSIRDSIRYNKKVFSAGIGEGATAILEHPVSELDDKLTNLSLTKKERAALTNDSPLADKINLNKLPEAISRILSAVE